VFNSDWTANPWWNENGGTITITNASTGCGGAGSGVPTYNPGGAANPGCAFANGQSVDIPVSFRNTNNTAYTGHLITQVWDGAMPVNKAWSDTQTIAANATATFDSSWNVPTSLPSGVQYKSYNIKVGVFSSDWTSNPFWDDNLANIIVTNDNSKFSFDCQPQGWTYNSGGMTQSTGPDPAQAFAGYESLHATFNGSNSDGEDIYTRGGPFPTTAGTVVTSHVWIPAGTNLSAIMPYVKEGASAGYNYTGNWYDVSALTTNAWNTVTVTVPTGTTFPLFEMGVTFFTSGTVNTKVYIDAVNW
jgi:hypothetical protein